MADEKILENEKLDDEQLENVAGGNIYQMEADAANFKKLGVLSANVDKHDKNAITAAFAAYGIATEQHGGYLGKDNKYSINGQKIDRDTAWAFVQQRWNAGYRPQVL